MFQPNRDNKVKIIVLSAARYRYIPAYLVFELVLKTAAMYIIYSNLLFKIPTQYTTQVTYICNHVGCLANISILI